MTKLGTSYKGRSVEMLDTVSVYRNLNKDTLSIKKGNLVCSYAEVVVLDNVKFNVGEKQCQKVIETGQKNVHATIKGELVYATDLHISIEKVYKNFGNPKHYKRVFYNPFKYDSFMVEGDNGLEPIKEYKGLITIVLDRMYIDR